MRRVTRKEWQQLRRHGYGARYHVGEDGHLTEAKGHAGKPYALARCNLTGATVLEPVEIVGGNDA